MVLQSIFHLVFVAFAFFNSSAQAYRVLIDPGHGGKDLGARQDTPHLSITEADVVWDWSLEIKRALSEKGIEVQLSRNEKQGLSITRRIQKIQNQPFDLVLSLHANYLLDSRVKGIEYFVAAPQSLEDQALQLAHEESLIKSGTKKAAKLNIDMNIEKKSQVSTILFDLQNQAKIEKSLFVAQMLNQTWPGKIKQGPFDLLSQSETPAILIELGFLSNPQDLTNLTNPSFRQTKATEIADVLARFLKRQYSPQL